MLNRCKIKGSVFRIFISTEFFLQHKPFFCHLTAIFHPNSNEKKKTSSCKIFLQKTGNKLLFEVFHER